MIDRANLAEINKLVELEQSIGSDIDVLETTKNFPQAVGVVRLINDRAELGQSLLQLADQSFPRQPFNSQNHWRMFEESLDCLHRFLLSELEGCRLRMRKLGVDGES